MRGLRFLARSLRPSTWIAVVRAALPGTTGVANFGTLSIKVFDVRPRARRDLPHLTAHVTEALRRLSAAGQGFGELVTSHLDGVVASSSGRVGAVASVRGYISTFDGIEAKSAHLLACNLVLAATVVRLTRDAERSGSQANAEHLKRTSAKVLRRFLMRFDQADEWISYFDLDKLEAEP